MTGVVVPLVALAALLAVAYRHPRARTELLVAVLAAAAVLATGVLDPDDLAAERDHLGPVVLFLVAILVVAECCRAAGLFAAIGSRLAAASHPGLLFAATFAVAAGTTVVLSLDATVVLLTPVAIAAAAALGVPGRPYELVCVRLANVASLLLPVSNLTNLLALPDLADLTASDQHMSVGRFALLMAPVWVLVLAVEYAVQRWWFRAELSASPVEHRSAPLPVPVAPLVVVTVMLAGFTAGSVLDPAWVAGAAAAVLVARGLARGELGVRTVAHSAHLAFAGFVLALGVVVAAVGEGPLGDLLADLVPSGDGLPALLAVAAIGAVVANVVNNLPATLLLVPLVAPLGAVPVLACLIGINLGSSMTWAGSLANLLWRRTVRRGGHDVSGRDFHAVGLIATPAAIVGGVVVLHLWSGVV